MQIKVFKNAEGKIYANTEGNILQIDVDNISSSGYKALAAESGNVYISPDENLLVLDYEQPEED